MTTFKIILSYDGTDFVGWQRQANGVSIQALIEDALRALDGRDVTVTGAGRTDAGVHALGQVAAFTLARELAPGALLRALNAHLPPAIRVLSAEDAPSAFHPRFGACAKTYRYQLWNGATMSPFDHGRAWHVPGPLDVEAMRAAAQLLVGRHDFAAFQATGSSVSTTVRDVAVSQMVDGGVRTREESLIESAMLTYEVAGSGFLRHMVRIIVGSLVEVGRGRRPVEWVGTLLASRDRTAAGRRRRTGCFWSAWTTAARLRQGLKSL
jgi:tRNA pseudouridine38-40 synthase